MIIEKFKVLVVVVLLFAPLHVVAAEPRVAVLALCSEGEGAKSEERFIGELELMLDGFVVGRESISEENFASLPLDRQLELIRPYAEEPETVAIIWLRGAGKSTTLLHLVALSTGRALVRIVEANEGPDTEEELALAARELLGEAYLFAPPTEGETAMRQVVGSVQAKVAPPSAETNEQPEDELSTFSLMVFFGSHVGVVGQAGPSSRIGGGVGLEWRPIKGLFTHLGLLIFGGPNESLRDGAVRGFGISPDIVLGYRFTVGRFALAPHLGFSIIYNRIEATIKENDAQSFSDILLRGFAGLGLGFAVNEGFMLSLCPAVGVLGSRDELVRLSDGSVIIRSPLLDFSLALEFAFSL